MTRVLLLVAGLLATGALATAEPLRQLKGTVPRALARMTDVGAAPADLPLEHVTVYLGLRHRAALDAVIAAQQDPRSPLFRRWLEPTEIADRFGARPARYERVRRWLVDHGFTIVSDSPYRAALVPGYVEARRVALCAGAYGISFAGAGPSVVAVTREGAERSVGEAIRAAFRKAGLASTLLVCAVDTRGARKAHA